MAERRLVAAALYGAAIMLDEIALMRILSFATWYHFAFLITSVAMLAAGAAGAWRSVRPGRAPFAGLFAAVALLSSIVVLHGAWFSSSLGALGTVLLLSLPPFVVSLALVDLLNEAPPAQIYAADLSGAGLGALAVLGLLPRVGSVGVVCIAAALTVLAYWLTAGGRFRHATLPLALALCVLAPFAAARFDPRVVEGKRVSPDETKTHLDLSMFHGEDALARIDVVPSDEGPRILIDGGSALSRVPRLAPRWRETAIEDDLSPVWTRAAGRSALVIGSGGGWEVARLVSHGARRVVAVEMSGVIVDYVRSQTTESVRHMFSDAPVELVRDEARSYLERSDERFDVIVMAHTIANAAGVSALFLTEDALLTTEAFATLRRHLSADGLLFITRPDAQIDALFALATVAFTDRAFTDPAFTGRTEIMALSWPSHAGFLSAVIVDCGADELPPLTGAVRRAPALTHAATASDDRPFFHALAMPQRSWRATLSEVIAADDMRSERMALEELPIGRTIAWLTVLVALFAWVATAGHRRQSWRMHGAAGLIGCAFMLVELTLMTRLSLLVGGASRAFTVVVCGLLAGAALSSLLLRSPAWARTSAVRAALSVLALGLVLPALVDASVEASLPVRLGTAFLLSAGAGVGVGGVFPLLLARAGEDTRARAWLWTSNGVAGVVGGGLGVLLPVAFGLRATLLVAAALYAATLLCLPLLSLPLLSLPLLSLPLLFLLRSLFSSKTQPGDRP